ncbi:MAG: SSS family solute:Na+ symporter [Kiritimatiellia bacterium]|jgi:SSS family solute:Na+ symporter
MNLTTFDLFIFFGSLIAIMGVGMWAGREEEDSEDFYLAGKRTKWWGVAGSIFGSNVSANHLVGMMGVGFAFGFAQSHFEITAIVGLLVLTYLLLPVYRKLNVFTLSEYLSQRYNEGTRLTYALIMLVIMIVIQMVPGFYIGSRSVNILLQGDTGNKAAVEAVVDAQGEVSSFNIIGAGRGYHEAPRIVLAEKGGEQAVDAEVVLTDGKISAITVGKALTGFNPESAAPKAILRGGSRLGQGLNPGDVQPRWYVIGILIMALVTGTYTIFGGLRAVIFTDVIQSVLLLIAGLVVAFVTFSQPEIGSWAKMVAMDKGADGMQRMHLYNSIDHPKLPWTGVLSGLMVLHFYYWGANQFIVQRALSARTGQEARLGIIVAGFFKLLIPFFSIGTGIAAFYMYRSRGVEVPQDAVFITLLKDLITPMGFGLVGLVAAGMIGAILSSLDSMMNSAATIFTFDIYKRFVNPNASEKQLVKVGRIAIVVFIVFATVSTVFIMQPNSNESFFLYVAKYQMFLVVGVVIAFFIGMLWPRATPAGGFAAIISGSAFCFMIPKVYLKLFAGNEAVTGLFGPSLNFFHSAFIAAVLSLVVMIVVSLLTKHDAEKAKLTWQGLEIFDAATQKKFFMVCGVSIAVFAILAVLMVQKLVLPVLCGLFAGAWVFGCFFSMALKAAKKKGSSLVREDRAWAGLLGACAIFMMYYFY